MAEQRTIDVTGLPEAVIEEIEAKIAGYRAADPTKNGTPPDVAERVRRFNEWLDRPRPPAPAFIDTDYDAIYEGCGE
jgi:hypothetical protein